MRTWEIFTYGNGEFLALIFNGIVALMGDGAFESLIRLAGVVGLLYVIFRAAFLSAGKADWGWFFLYITLYGALFVPKVNVTIVDRIIPNNTRTIANVPIGLGVLAATLNQVGDWMTRAAESVYTLPNDLQYQTNGAVFGAELLSAAGRWEITNPDFLENMQEFLRQCVFYDLLLRNYTWRELTEAPDTWVFIRNTTSRFRYFRFSCYTPPFHTPNELNANCGNSDHTVLYLQCRDGARTTLTNAWTFEVDRASKIFGRRIFTDEQNQALASARLLATLPVSYDYLADVTKSASDIMRANMLANTLRRSLSNAAANVDAAGAVQDMAVAQAEVQQRSTYETLGVLMGKYLPLMRNIYEGLLYGIFPFIFLLILLPMGMRIASGYVKHLVWLQFWPPLYAILNLLMTLDQQSKSLAASKLEIGTNVLSLATHSGLAQVATDTAILAGFMTTSVPLIAYGLVTGGQMALTQLASQIGSVAQAAAARSAATTTSGNLQLGTYSVENTGMFQNTTSPTTHAGGFTKFDPTTGATHTGALGTDRIASSAMVSRVGWNIDVSRSHQIAHETQYAQLEQAQQKYAVGYVESTAAALGEGLDYASRTGFGRNYGTTWSDADRAEISKLWQAREAISERLQESEQFSKEEADQIALEAMASIKGGIGKGIVGASGEISINGRHISTDTWREALEIAKDVTSSEEIQKGLSALEQVVRQDAASTTFEAGKQLTEQVRSHLEEAERYQSQIEATRTRMKQFNEAWSIAERMDTAARAELADQFLHAARQTGLHVETERLVDPLYNAASAQAAALWYGLVKGGADPVEAAEGALLSTFRKDGPAYGELFSKLVADKVTGGGEAVDEGFRHYTEGVGTKGDVLRAAEQNENEGPGSMANANALNKQDAELGRLPGGAEGDSRNLKEKVDTGIENQNLDIEKEAAKSREEADKTASKVPQGIGEGRANTGWLPGWLSGD
ncbi:MAG TPA: conjugal transfer protein TraG [Thiotrichales bacterium]|nr:conjugal transfer protein TraG [Thiotrichales bacterium]